MQIMMNTENNLRPEPVLTIRRHEDFESPEASRPKRHSGLRITLCTSGIADVSVSGTEYRLVPGTMLVLMPGTLSCVNASTHDYEARVFYIPKEFIRNMPMDMKRITTTFALLTREPIFNIDDMRMSDFDNYMTLFKGLAANAGDYRYEAMQGVVMSLVYYVCDIVKSQSATAEDQLDIMQAHDRKNYYMIRFIDLLGRHCIEERSVAFYAGKMFITPKYLSSIIKEVSGKSASEWINEFVMTEAKMRLRKPDNNISETAYQLNFSNISFFGKFFKRHTGMSPSDYKRNCRSA